MDITAFLDDLTYRVLAGAASGKEARVRLAIVAHWAAEQDARLAAGKRNLRLDSAVMVAEALSTSAAAGPRTTSGRVRGRPSSRPKAPPEPG